MVLIWVSLPGEIVKEEIEKEILKKNKK